MEKSNDDTSWIVSTGGLIQFVFNKFTRTFLMLGIFLDCNFFSSLLRQKFQETIKFS